MNTDNKKAETKQCTIPSVNCWRNVLSDPPELEQEIEVLYDDGFETPDEIIKTFWGGCGLGRENLQEVMYCWKKWRACS